MDEKDKELLLKDLCGRLPYGVKTSYSGFEMIIRGVDVESKTVDVIDWGKARFAAVRIEKIKPYLRPMDSMTEEECDMVEVILGDENIFDFMRNGDIILKEGKFTQVMLSRLYDYFNSIHVDYRGLIPKGLALEAKDGMYNA